MCCLKIGETFTKTSKLSTVSRRTRKFEVVFPGKGLNQRIHQESTWCQNQVLIF